MADSTPVNVSLDAEAAKRAEERLNALIDREVAEGVAAAMKDRTNMDAADKAALEAAQTDAKTARQEVASIKASLDALNQTLKAQADSAAKEADARVDTKARRVALLRAGGDAKRVTDTEVARLRGLGEAALDEMNVLLTSAGRAPPPPKPVALKNEAGEDSGIVLLRDGSYAVADWNKHPSPTGDTKKAMGHVVRFPTVGGN